MDKLRWLILITLFIHTLMPCAIFIDYGFLLRNNVLLHVLQHYFMRRVGWLGQRLYQLSLIYVIVMLCYKRFLEYFTVYIIILPWLSIFMMPVHRSCARLEGVTGKTAAKIVKLWDTKVVTAENLAAEIQILLEAIEEWVL